MHFYYEYLDGVKNLVGISNREIKASSAIPSDQHKIIKKSDNKRFSTDCGVIGSPSPNSKATKETIGSGQCCGDWVSCPLQCVLILMTHTPQILMSFHFLAFNQQMN